MNKDNNAYKNYIFNEDEYNKTKDKYYLKFSSFPPTLIGIGCSHPIYMYLMENALENNKKIDDDDINEAIALFNVYDIDKYY